MKPHESFIIDGIVSEERVKEQAQERYVRSQKQTRLHYHTATVEHCNNRCTWWPQVTEAKSK